MDCPHIPDDGWRPPGTPDGWRDGCCYCCGYDPMPTCGCDCHAEKRPEPEPVA